MTADRLYGGRGPFGDTTPVALALRAIGDTAIPPETTPPAETTVAGIGDIALTGVEETATETTEPTETTKVTPIPELPLITGEAALEQRRRQIFKDNGIPKAPYAGRRRR